MTQALLKHFKVLGTDKFKAGFEHISEKIETEAKWSLAQRRNCLEFQNPFWRHHEIIISFPLPVFQHMCTLTNTTYLTHKETSQTFSIQGPFSCLSHCIKCYFYLFCFVFQYLSTFQLLNELISTNLSFLFLFLYLFIQFNLFFC